MSDYNINVNVQGGVGSGGSGGSGGASPSTKANEKFFSAMSIQFGKMGVIMGRIENHGAATALAGTAVLAALNEFMDVMKPLFRMLLLPIRILASFFLAALAKGGVFQILAEASNQLVRLLSGDTSGVTNTLSDYAKDPIGVNNELNKMLPGLLPGAALTTALKDIWDGLNKLPDPIKGFGDWLNHLIPSVSAASIAMGQFAQRVVGVSDPNNKIWGGSGTGNIYQTSTPGGGNIYSDWHTTLPGDSWYDSPGVSNPYSQQYGLTDASYAPSYKSTRSPQWYQPNGSGAVMAALSSSNSLEADTSGSLRKAALGILSAQMPGDVSGNSFQHTQLYDQDTTAILINKMEQLISAAQDSGTVINISGVSNTSELVAELDAYYQQRNRARTISGTQG